MRVLLIGKNNCSRCDMVKNILSNKNIEFEYILMESLPQEDQVNYRKMAIIAKQMEMPLIIKENKIATIAEVI
jgi:glutaredoxin